MVRRVRKNENGRFEEYFKEEKVPFRELYFDWLCQHVCTDEEIHDYSMMLNMLFDYEFYWINGLDENRAKDGKLLRREFCNEYLGVDFEVFDGPCSVLEMLIGFTKIMSFNMEGFVEDNSLRRWFWEMIDNIDATFMTNFELISSEKRNSFLHKVSHVLDRNYSKKGEGSLFPVKKCRKDFRKIELLYQFYIYVDEKYPI